MAERVRAWPVLGAFLRQALLEQLTEATALALSLASLALGLVSQAYLARLVDATPNPQLGTYTGHFAAFLIVGMGLLDLQNAVVGGLARKLRAAQQLGSLEAMLVTPAPAGLILAGLAAPDVAASLVRLALYAAVGQLFFGLRFGAASFTGAACVLILSVAAFAALALVGAALTMTLRRADPLNLLLAAAALIAGGVVYPRGILPEWLRLLSGWLPIAPALDGMRAALVHGQGPAALFGPLGRLAILVAVLLPAGAWLFGRALARARHDGSLTAY